MNDPWVDERKKAKRNWQDAPYPLAQARTDFDKLQRNADALLATLQKIAGMNEPLDEAAYHPADAVWMRTAARQALAALPEHLK